MHFHFQGPLSVTTKQSPQQGHWQATCVPIALIPTEGNTSAAQQLSGHRGFAGNISPGSSLLWPLVTCFFCPVTNLGQK